MSLFRPLFPEMARMMRAFDDPFFNALRRAGPAFQYPGSSFARAPRVANVDVTESDREYRVIAELPGIDRNLINIEVVDENTLQIHGSRGGSAEPAAEPKDTQSSPASTSESASTGSVAKRSDAEGAVQAGDRGHEFIAQERWAEEFSRSITFPHRIKADTLRAQYENGLLEITIPKEAPEARRVKVNIE